MSAIEFNEATHSYRVGGQPFVSVTAEMGECGLTTETFFDEQGRERGRFVHAFCAAQDRKNSPFVLETMPDHLRADYFGYGIAWENAKRDLGLEIQLIEHRVSDAVRGYAGTLDREVVWKNRLAIVELKTGAIQPVTALQLVAYGNALEASRVFERIAVQLMPDGRFRVEHYQLASYIDDLHDFWATLRVAAWIRKNR